MITERDGARPTQAFWLLAADQSIRLGKSITLLTLTERIKFDALNIVNKEGVTVNVMRFGATWFTFLAFSQKPFQLL